MHLLVRIHKIAISFLTMIFKGIQFELLAYVMPVSIVAIGNLG